MTMYRQGDVLLIAVHKTPEGAKLVPRGKRGLVLASGEATGHAHVITAECASLYTLRELDDEMERYLSVVETPAEVTHEEHGTLTVPPGDYLVRRQREYTPTELRPVSD